MPRAVRRALDAMREDVGRDWSVPELAALGGVSGRTLQRQFRTFLGKAPRAVLRDLRYESARRELLQGIQDMKVTDVALRCGLAHFGRFAVEYRRRYGETPSQTLKRQAVFIGALTSMPTFFSSGRHRPTLALEPIEASVENGGAARGAADELAAALARAGVSVVNQPSSARYRICGAIRESGRQAHLTLRLIENGSGRHLWSHRCDAGLSEVAASEGHIATRVAAALQPYLRLAEIDRAQRKPDIDMNPHDLTLRAIPGVLSLDAVGNAQALDLLDLAIHRDPDDALAIALASWAHLQRVVYHFTVNPQEDRARGAELVRRAQSLAGDATVLAVLGNALTLLNELDAAEVAIQKALALDGGSAWAWSRSGWIDVYKGNSESAIERFKIALDLAPHDSLAFNNLVGIGCAHFEAGRYLDAAHWQERALAEHPSAIWVHRTLCSAYVLAGANEKARRSLAALRDRYPDLTVSEVQRGFPPLTQDYCDRVVDALHVAGLPFH